MTESEIRKVFYYENHFLDFFDKLKPDVQRKVIWTIKLIETIERVPEKYIKHLTGTTRLYEIRIECGSVFIVFFCFFDKGKLVILINGFHKKTQKTPKKEIEIAEKLKQKYLNELKNK
jgi:phage-related protein